MSDAAPIIAGLDALPNAKVRGAEHTARCPAHEDRVSSLTWTVGQDGRVLVKCHAGCSADAITAAMGLAPRDLFPPTNGAARPHVVNTTAYEVRDTDGPVLAIHERRDMSDGSKRIAWKLPDAPGYGLGGRSVASLPLYGADKAASWRAGATVLVVEGEKASEALWRAGVAAVATYGADHRPDPGPLGLLRGRVVTLWPDADEPGRRHMLDMAERLDGIASEVRWLAPPDDAPKGWDAADCIALADDPKAALRELKARIGPVPLSTAVDDAVDNDLTGLRLLADVADEPMPPMLIERLHPTGPTVLFGPGDVGKGALSCYWVSQLVAAGHRVLVIDYEHTGEWRGRLGSLAPTALLGTYYMAPLSAEWKGPDGAIWQQADAIREACDRYAITYIVIDSIALACVGADVTEQATAAQYAKALIAIGRAPSLSLAHVNRANDYRYPFGSVFFANLCRLSWSMEADEHGAILTIRKSNNYAPLGRRLVSMTWHDGKLREVWDRSYTTAVAEQAAEVLDEDGPLSKRDLLARINEDRPVPVSADTLKRALSRSDSFHYSGGRWTHDD